MPRRLPVASAVVLLAGVLAGSLAGCSSTVHLDPADDANSPRCAEVSVRLQNVPSIDGHDRRWTDAQATAAWGDPSVVLLTCGLPEAEPTSRLQCITLQGIDWLVDDSQSPYLRLTTYGRKPAVQLYIDSKPGRGVSANDVIGNKSLAAAIATIPADHACTARPGADATPAPAPSPTK
ncbi:DUF3515 family protein [Microbacterium sp. ASV81]|uniref:DUF3515 family protein n=1 Tax=Microbacterium capsulatum TaxID=3041921 RepID=A0ABU0XDI0_9MICO|nr:DUF3515 family protein [Microbacterium sp. ASV81]MDQ4213173.1 DUF3515 family protein [Microbacterium sp. ASV81]